MSDPDAPGLRELGIDAIDADLLAAAGSEVAIVEETAVRLSTKRPRRNRPGPLVGNERVKVVSEAVSALKRDLFVLLAATDGLSEVSNALLRAGLELRRYPLSADTIAENLRKQL